MYDIKVIHNGRTYYVDPVKPIAYVGGDYTPVTETYAGDTPAMRALQDALVAKARKRQASGATR